MYNTLKAKLAERHMTVYALAKATGISSSLLYRAVGGKMVFFPGWKRRIADALDCSVDELFPSIDEE